MHFPPWCYFRLAEMKRFLVLVCLFSLSAPSFAQADLQDVVDAVDEVAELIAELNGRLGYSDQRFTVQGTLEDLASDLFYWTNNAPRNPRGWPSGIRRDVLALGGLVSLTNVFHEGPKVWDETPDGGYGFLPFYDQFGSHEFYTESFTEFLALTIGQGVDSTMWNVRFADMDFDEAWTNAFRPDLDFAPNSASFWSIWEAEAWRRLLSAVQDNDSTSWTNNLAATNALDEAYQQAGLTNETGEAVSLSLPAPVEVNTNAVVWFGDGNSAAPKLAGDLEWALQGESNEVRIFGFDELDKNLSGTLAVDFTSAPFPFIRTCCRLLVAVSTCVCLFMILRHEVDYWTTLGGSAT